MNELTIRECPFCGGEPTIYEIPPHNHSDQLKKLCPDLPDHKGSWVVECVCGCGLIDETKEGVLNHWNLRPTLDRLERAEGLLKEGYDEMIFSKLEGTGHECHWCACDGETPETIEHEPDCFVGKTRTFLGEDGIEQLGLSIRPLYCLRKAGITDINQVAKLSFDELMEIKNMGRKGSEEVLKKVQAFLAERETVSEMERVGKL
jgi:DNA-directed RNA polymerase, alpha subunit/40 kD subunit